MQDNLRGTIGVEPLETERHSFVIRIWIEEATDAQGRALWRGSISHVPDGERGPLRSLDDIPRFIAPFLERWGVDLGWRWRVKRQIDAWTNRQPPHITSSSSDKVL